MLSCSHEIFFFFMIMGKILFFLFLFNASNTKWNLLSPWVERKENSLDTSAYNFLANESMNCVYFSDSSPLPLASVSTYTAFFLQKFSSFSAFQSALLCHKYLLLNKEELPQPKTGMSENVAGTAHLLCKLACG